MAKKSCAHGAAAREMVCRPCLTIVHEHLKSVEAQATEYHMALEEAKATVEAGSALICDLKNALDKEVQQSIRFNQIVWLLVKKAGGVVVVDVHDLLHLVPERMALEQESLPGGGVMVRAIRL